MTKPNKPTTNRRKPSYETLEKRLKKAEDLCAKVSASALRASREAAAELERAKNDAAVEALQSREKNLAEILVRNHQECHKMQLRGKELAYALLTGTDDLTLTKQYRALLNRAQYAKASWRTDKNPIVSTSYIGEKGGNYRVTQFIGKCPEAVMYQTAANTIRDIMLDSGRSLVGDQGGLAFVEDGYAASAERAASADRADRATNLDQCSGRAHRGD